MIKRRAYDRKATRKEKNALKTCVILQHVDGSGLSSRAIMEATGAVKDVPVIRELLDEALGARLKAAGIYNSGESPGQGIAETPHTLQTLLLRLIRRRRFITS